MRRYSAERLLGALMELELELPKKERQLPMKLVAKRDEDGTWFLTATGAKGHKYVERHGYYGPFWTTRKAAFGGYLAVEVRHGHVTPLKLKRARALLEKKEREGVRHRSPGEAHELQGRELPEVQAEEAGLLDPGAA